MPKTKYYSGKNHHEGHRERMKNQFLEHGIEHLAPHQVLELVLFFAIPRVDTNLMAHELLSRFGSLAGVFNAGVRELCEVPGIGMNAATLLKLIPEVHKMYSYSMYENIPLSDVDTIFDFVISLYHGVPVESVTAICLDGSMRILSNTIISKGNSCYVELDRSSLLARLSNSGCQSCIIAHNHPGTSAKPSSHDKLSTYSLKTVFDELSINLYEHVIVGDDGVYAIMHDRFRRVRGF